jgi:FlaA1/EpsC-like NDP-sugar epimerase
MGNIWFKQRVRMLQWLGLDLFLLSFSMLTAVVFMADNPQISRIREVSDTLADHLPLFVIFILLKIFIFWAFGIYRHIWRYASIFELSRIFLWCVATMLSCVTIALALQEPHIASIMLVAFVFDGILIAGSRIAWRLLSMFQRQISAYIDNPHSNVPLRRVMIVGAGESGRMIIDEMLRNPHLRSQPVLMVDDDPMKRSQVLRGVTIAGSSQDIPKLAVRHQIDEIIVAVPTASLADRKRILEICNQTSCRLRTLPGLFELIGGQVSVSQVRDVDIADLLGREEVKLDNESISGYLCNRIVLVTGGGGSIGSELCRQIARFNPHQLIILDIYENSTYDLELELRHSFPRLNLDVIIASLRDRERVDEIFHFYHPDVVFHAAAHKHVPLMERSPKEAVKNNVFGTFNAATAAKKYGVQRFVMISTDKAVNPTNVMGATKRLCEMIIQAKNDPGKTEFVAVRFGNVLGSNGSVIPIFKRQIANGGPVTVTHPEITRFFMTIPEASQLVIQAGAIAKGGEIFVLDMGEPVKIRELAEKLIRLSGFEPGHDIKIQYTGLRPGEKLYEELMMSEEGLGKTSCAKIFIGKTPSIDREIMLKNLDRLWNIRNQDDSETVKLLMELVPTYKPPVAPEA